MRRQRTTRIFSGGATASSATRSFFGKAPTFHGNDWPATRDDGFAFRHPVPSGRVVEGHTERRLPGRATAPAGRAPSPAGSTPPCCVPISPDDLLAIHDAVTM